MREKYESLSVAVFSALPAALGTLLLRSVFPLRNRSHMADSSFWENFRVNVSLPIFRHIPTPMHRSLI